MATTEAPLPTAHVAIHHFEYSSQFFCIENNLSGSFGSMQLCLTDGNSSRVALRANYRMSKR